MAVIHSQRTGINLVHDQQSSFRGHRTMTKSSGSAAINQVVSSALRGVQCKLWALPPRVQFRLSAKRIWPGLALPVSQEVLPMGCLTSQRTIRVPFLVALPMLPAMLSQMPRWTR